MPEIELKLRGTPARLKVALARLEKKAVKGSAFKKSLRAVYFDTAKDDLRDKGLSFRVRDEDGRFIQTLKQEAANGEALTRGEWSDDVAAAAPELLNTKSGRKLRHVWKDVRLLPRFRTVIAREGFVLSPRRGTQVEVVRDEGEIQAIGKETGRDDETVRVSEIEIELKQGSPRALYDLALQILEAAPVQIETRAKSDRGYALLAAAPEIAAVKSEAPKVIGSETLAEVLRSAARRHFGQYLAGMAGAREQDPASIHQMRVAMRRLRSALYGVRDLLPEAEYESVRVKLKYLLQSLGAARDWEVLTERISELDDEDEREGQAENVQRAANAEKRQALVRAVDALASRKNTQAALEAMRWFEDLPTARHGRKLKTKAKAAAAGILTELFDRVRRRGRNFEEQSVGDRHRLRIACKNLRYNVELFGALYGKRKAERFLARLKPVQDDLGHLNDVSRARDLLGDLAKRSPQKAAADAVVARLEARVTAADKRARKHVATLRNAKAFW
jgi:inorganic triphosphatase YgiF